MTTTRSILLGTLTALLVTFPVLRAAVNRPRARVHGPTSRYHGYQLNHDAIRRAKLFTVLISGEGFGGTARGTGLLIDSRHVLTCAHVMSQPSDETLLHFYPGYLVAKGKLVYADVSKDLAVVEIDVQANSPVYPVFQENVYDGQPITIIGNILGSMKWFVSYGIVSGGNARDLFTDGLIRGGNSGGPWINEAGEVVAISDWGLYSKGGESLGINGGVSAKTINQFLKSWRQPNVMDLLFGVLQSAPRAK